MNEPLYLCRENNFIKYCYVLNGKTLPDIYNRETYKTEPSSEKSY